MVLQHVDFIWERLFIVDPKPIEEVTLLTLVKIIRCGLKLVMYRTIDYEILPRHQIWWLRAFSVFWLLKNLKLENWFSKINLVKLKISDYYLLVDDFLNK